MIDIKDPRYTPYGVERLSDAELKAAYAELSERAAAELRKISKSRVFASADVLARNKDFYPSIEKISGYKNPRAELEWRTVEAAAQLRSKRGTLKGLYEIRRKQIQALRERGYKNINSKNYKKAVEAIQRYASPRLDSDQILEIFDVGPEKALVDFDESNDFERFKRGVARAVERRYKGPAYAGKRASIRAIAANNEGVIAAAYYSALRTGKDLTNIATVRAIRKEVRQLIYGDFK